MNEYPTTDFDDLSSAVHFFNICKTRLMEAQTALETAQRSLAKAQETYSKAREEWQSAKDKVSSVIKNGKF